MKRRKKRKLNLALLLMAVASICLSTLQVGFSFFDANFLIGGVGTIDYNPEETAVDVILQANLNFIDDGASDAAGNIVGQSGYTQVVRASTNSTINNYLKFSENATELWRIVGFTEYGIKIVKDQPIVASQTPWDTGSNHWVDWSSFSQLPYQINVTSLTNACSIATYLNTTYYQSLINSSSANYVNPIYINHEAVWDITPMTKTPSYASGIAPQYITCKATVSNGFVGLPIGLLGVNEFAFTSSAFATASPNDNIYDSVFTGWLANTTGTEMTINECITSVPTANSQSSSSIWIQSNKFTNSNKSSTGNSRYFRPAMYLYSDVTLTTVTGASGSQGSRTNPFVVSGR